MSADDSSAGVQPGVLEVPPDHGESLRPWIPAAIIAVSCALNLVLLFDWWPSLRGIGWRWDYVPPSATLLVRLLPAVVVLAVYCAGLIVLRRCEDWLFMTWSIMGAIGVPVTLLYLIGDPLFLLFSRTVSQYATGAFAASLAITDPSRTLAEWPAMMPGMRASLPHMAISSPAWGFIYYGFAKVLALNSTLNARLALPLIPMVCQEFGFLSLNDNQIASTWLGIASPLWAALTVIPIHNLGVQIGGRRLARHAIAWWPLVPALAMFAATLNSVYPLFTTTAVALYFSSLRSSQDWLAHAKRLAVGLLLGLLLLWNFSLVPVLLLCGILALAVWGQGPRRSRFHGLPWLCLVGLEVALGLILVWGLYTLKADHSPLNLLLVSMRSHLSVVRPYLPWLGLHTWDIVLFAGLPASTLAIVGLFVRRGDAYRQFALALGLTLVILVLSGTARGETGRVWMFFMPLILLLTAGALISLGLTARIVLMGAQILWLLTVALVLRTIITGDVMLPARYQEVAFRPLQQQFEPTQANFDHQLELTGYQAVYQPVTNSVRLALHWQPLRQLRKPYYFSAVLVGPNGEVLPGVNWQPFETRYPTTCWYQGASSAGEIVDQIDLPTGVAPAPGNWWISLSAFELPQEGPSVGLPVILPDGQRDTQVGLGPIEVKATQ